MVFVEPWRYKCGMIYFRRSIDLDLLEWAQAPRRKPLVLRGARQTGKTASVRHLGQGFELFLELNLERHEDRTLVRTCRSAEDLLAALQVRHNIVRFPPRTLLFLDEIQESAEAIRWLRFFHEDHPELYVVAAGSLMEVRLQERGFSFPVGRVTFRYLHPFSFLEFLEATDREVLSSRLRAALQAPSREGAPLPRIAPVLAAIHGLAMGAFREYLLVGGMPEAVRRWVSESSPVAVRQVHHDLVQALAEDLHKYGGVRDTAHMETAFGALRHHYGLRFKYTRFAPGLPSQRTKAALDRLEAAMVCRRVLPSSDFVAPLSIKSRAAPKLLPLDVGVALATMAVPWPDIRTRPLDALRNGRVAEMVAGQLLLSADRRTGSPLHFWVRERPRGNAEVDYLVPTPTGLVPVEVKAGAGGGLKSLHQLLWRSGQRTGVRLHGDAGGTERLGVQMGEGRMEYELVSLPLYLAELVPTLALEHEDAAP